MLSSPPHPVAPLLPATGDPVLPDPLQNWQPGSDGDILLGLRDNTLPPSSRPSSPSSGSRRTRDIFEGDNNGDGGFSFQFGGSTFVAQDHSALVTREVRRRRLTVDDERQLREFSREPLDAKLISMQASVMELLNMSVAQAAVEQFVLTKEAKAAIIMYSAGSIYSPVCSAYVGPGVVDCVLMSMRARHVEGLPSADDMGRVLVVRSAISDALTDKRHKLKAAIAKSLPPASSSETAETPSGAVATSTASAFVHTDIATLCAAITKGSTVKVTLAFYHRVAFLRRTLARQPDNFWKTVDERLGQVRIKYPQKTQYEDYFKRCYDDDVKVHGDPPRLSGYVRENQRETWQVVMEDNSTNAAAMNKCHST